MALEPSVIVLCSSPPQPILLRSRSARRRHHRRCCRRLRFPAHVASPRRLRSALPFLAYGGPTLRRPNTAAPRAQTLATPSAPAPPGRCSAPRRLTRSASPSALRTSLFPASRGSTLCRNATGALAWPYPSGAARVPVLATPPAPALQCYPICRCLPTHSSAAQCDRPTIVTIATKRKVCCNTQYPFEVYIEEMAVRVKCDHLTTLQRAKVNAEPDEEGNLNRTGGTGKTQKHHKCGSTNCLFNLQRTRGMCTDVVASILIGA